MAVMMTVTMAVIITVIMTVIMAVRYNALLRMTVFETRVYG